MKVNSPPFCPKQPRDRNLFAGLPKVGLEPVRASGGIREGGRRRGGKGVLNEVTKRVERIGELASSY